MKISKYGSATVKIEVEGTTVLCDPWLIDGVYYGSWHNYPPVDLSKYDLKKIDYIYVSHVHPDHFDPRTMDLLDRNTPVLIHQYHQKFLKANIERLGFTVIELENGVPFELSSGCEITIFAADNCDPSICGRMFGCVTPDVKGSMQLDSLCVIKTERFTMVNTNDCPYGIAETTLKQVKECFPTVDFALVGYSSASLFPHCMMEYTKDEMERGKKKAKLAGLISGLEILRTLQPRFYMPFAGTYIPGGYAARKYQNMPIVELQEAAEFFGSDDAIKTIGSVPVLLNYAETFDLDSEKQTSPYRPIDKQKRADYVERLNRTVRYEFEDDPMPDTSEIQELMRTAFERMKRKQLELGFFEDLNIVIDLPEAELACFNLADASFSVIQHTDNLQNYHRFRLDPRLLKRALLGPRLANWNNIEIGGLLDFARKPDVFRKDVHTLINSFHV